MRSGLLPRASNGVFKLQAWKLQSKRLAVADSDATTIEATIEDLQPTRLHLPSSTGSDIFMTNFSTSGTMVENSDLYLSSQKATKTYVDSVSGGGAGGTVLAVTSTDEAVVRFNGLLGQVQKFTATPITASDTGAMTVANTTASTTTGTGCVILAGGLGVAGNISSLTVNSLYSKLLTTNVVIGNSTSGSAITSGAANVIIGVGSGQALTSGSDCIVIGNGALTLVTTSSSDACIAIGTGSQAVNVSGQWNNSIGYHSLFALTTGDFNSAWGYNSLAALTTGSANTGVGYRSGFGMGDGCADNVIIGNQTFDNTTDGAVSQNVGIGKMAGRFVKTSGSNNNVFLGYNAGALSGVSSIALTNNVIVGSGAIGANGMSNCITIGANITNSASDANLVQLGNSSHSVYKFNGSAFTTNGVVVTNSNALTSTTTISPEITFSTGVKLATSGGTAATLDFYEKSYAHTTNWTGAAITGNVAGNLTCSRIGNMIMIAFPSILGVGAIANPSDHLLMTTVLPARFRPTATSYFVIEGTTIGGATFCLLTIESGGDMYVGVGASQTIYSGDDSSLNGILPTYVSYLV